MNIYLGQINPTVGAIKSNSDRILEVYENGMRAGADLIVVPEMAVTGYPPRDLLDKRVFVDANLEARDRIASTTGEATLIFGCVTRNPGSTGKPFHNTAVVARNGKIVHEQPKSLLPTYDVFNEARYFEPADSVSLVEISGLQTGVLICEDFWFDDEVFGRPLYDVNPVDQAMNAGAELLINISASPFNVGKKHSRFDLFGDIAREHAVPLVYVNQVGGNDELLFDGASLVYNTSGDTIYCGPSFVETEALVTLESEACNSLPNVPREGQIAEAVMMGVRDYLGKTGFADVVIGLSGGIDSAVTAALAVMALGSEHVTGITMPSRFSSRGSVDDSFQLGKNMNFPVREVPIDDIYKAYLEQFRPMFEDDTFSLTEENVQARIRGNLLMAWSNENGSIVLATGNKSELAVGYCTLYGDMSGGLAVLGDIYKTTVYDIARWINRERELIPESSITKPPSAELRPDQTDQQSLPPYEVLDGILRLYIEKWLEVDEIVATGYDEALVRRVIRLVDGNEFKRRQAAPTLRISTKAFGSGRQMPIAQRWGR